MCERVFLPPKQELRRSSQSGTPLLTIESQTPGRATSTCSRSPSRSSGTTRTSSRCCAWPACRRAPTDAHAARSARRHRRRGDVRQPRAARAVRRRDRRRRRGGARSRADARACASRRRSRAICYAGSPRSAGFYIPSFYDVATRRRHDRGVRAEARHRRAAGREEGGGEEHRSRSIRRRRRSSRPIPSSARGSSSRSSAAARICAASAGPATTTCRCGRSRPIGSSSSRARRGPHANRVGLVSIALCDHPEIERILRGPDRDGLLDQPGLAAARRPDANRSSACCARAASGRSRSRRRPAPTACAA